MRINRKFGLHNLGLSELYFITLIYSHLVNRFLFINFAFSVLCFHMWRPVEIDRHHAAQQIIGNIELCQHSDGD